MTTKTKAIIASAAIAGLISGSAVRVMASTSPDTGTNSDVAGIQKMGCSGKDGCKGSHECKGKNECKGKGGCKSGDNGCKGKNSCKGKGGCKSSHDHKEGDKH
jgi:hypothetical protein